MRMPQLPVRTDIGLSASEVPRIGADVITAVKAAGGRLAAIILTQLTSSRCTTGKAAANNTLEIACHEIAHNIVGRCHCQR